MKIKVTLLDKYILKEMLMPFIFGAGLFLSFFLIDLFMELVDDIISKGVSFINVIKYFLYAIPSFLVLVLPMGALFGVLLGISRMNSDGEITAAVAGGISYYRLFAPVLISALCLTIFDWWLADVVVPKSRKHLARLHYIMMSKNPLPKIAKNVFIKLREGRVFYIREFDERKKLMKGIFAIEKQPRAFPIVIEAKFGETKLDGWHLYDGNFRVPDNVGKDRYFATFEEMIIPTQVKIKKRDIQKNSKLMPSWEIKKTIKKFKKMGLPTNYMQVEYYLRFAIPMATLIFTLLALPMSVGNIRSGKAIGAGMSVIIIVVYYMLMSLGKALAVSGKVPAIFGAWLQNIVIGLVALGLFLKLKWR